MLELASVRDLPVKAPFKEFALKYFELGWFPLPLPYKEKFPPPEGFTGRFDPPGREQVLSWIENSGRENIGLRLPDGVIGIDVDAYGKKSGGKTLEELEESCGALPETWVLTARSDGVSGIRFFKVEKGLRWIGSGGLGIDVVSFRYRYVVGYPSIHPELKKIYKWYPPGAKLGGPDYFSGVPDLREI